MRQTISIYGNSSAVLLFLKHYRTSYAPNQNIGPHNYLPKYNCLNYCLPSNITSKEVQTSRNANNSIVSLF